jgi:hypothetical protein
MNDGVKTLNIIHADFPDVFYNLAQFLVDRFKRAGFKIIYIEARYGIPLANKHICEHCTHVAVITGN